MLLKLLRLFLVSHLCIHSLSLSLGFSGRRSQAKLQLHTSSTSSIRVDIYLPLLQHLRVEAVEVQALPAQRRRPEQLVLSLALALAIDIDITITIAIAIAIDFTNRHNRKVLSACRPFGFRKMHLVLQLYLVLQLHLTLAPLLRHLGLRGTGDNRVAAAPPSVAVDAVDAHTHTRITRRVWLRQILNS